MLAIMKKFKNGCHFVNINPMEKFQITDPLPKVWVSSFPSVNRNGISVSAIMKKLKIGCHFININCMEKFQITDPHKVLVSSFPSVDRNRISASAIMKKLKNGCHFSNIDRTETFQITNSPKVWVSGVDGNGISLENWRCKCSFFLNFPLVHFSPSPFLGSISIFMCGYS